MHNPGNGGVPIVAHGAAQPGDMANVPPVPTSAPSGADASAGLRSGASQGPPPGNVNKAAHREPLEQVWHLPTAIIGAHGR